MKFNKLVNEALAKTSKFDIAWQLVRTKARDIKEPSKKIMYVLNFLEQNPNIHNYNRIMNWLKMTKIGYKDIESQRLFNNAIEQIENKKDSYNDLSDNNVSIKNVSDSNLMLVYNDLKKRKYGFQFKSVPKAHTEFMIELGKEINRRGL